MRKILRRLEVVTDDWQYLPANAAQEPAANDVSAESSNALIVPLAGLRDNAPAWQSFAGRLGAALKPADKVEDLAPNLSRLALVAIEFPGPGDGRGYTQARLLRERYKFTGELRAVGAGVKQDLLFFMARSGIDAFELAPGEDFESAQRALRKYTAAYQPGAPHESVQRQRFFA